MAARSPRREAREREKAEFDAFRATCPSRRLLDRLSDKWVTLVLLALATGSRRHAELARVITGVSQKMLTQTLRTLEADGLVLRTVTPSVPVRVDYELTDLGRSLLPVMRALRTWMEVHLSEVEAARQEYATVHGSPSSS